MLSDYMGILSLNENSDNIKSLTKNRIVASIPIAGRYRIIDFSLSNMVNAGITSIGIFTQSKSRSLVDHIGSGKPWDLDRKIDGLFVFNFGESSTHLQDIQMIKNNMEYLYRSKKDMVIISTASMICNIDYKDVARVHEESGRDITLVYKKIPANTPCFKDCNVLNLSKDNSIIGVGKNVTSSFQDANNDLTCEGSVNLSMGMFVLSKDLLIKLLNNCIKTGCWIDLKNCIYDNIFNFKTNAYEFKGHLSFINSVQSYYKANMDILNLDINKDLFFSNGLIYTKVMDESPTKYFSNSKVCNSLIANGCQIKGKVSNSVLSRRVYIEEGAEINNCIIMQGCTIKSNAKLHNVIIDKNNVIDANTELKGDVDFPLVIEKKLLY